ncbi:MAG: hypothetical protein IKX84_08505 [Clostridia bacterium]|nr:hypothetical protein [Clostridia bacterium]
MGASELVNSWEWTSRADILLAVLKIAALGLMAAGLLCRSKKASAAFLALGCVLYLGLSVREISDAVFQTAHNRGAYLRYLYAVLTANGLRVLLLALCGAMCLARLFSARKSALSALRLPAAILAGMYLAALALSCILKQQVYSRRFDWYSDVLLTLLSFVPAAMGAFSLVFSAPRKGPALQADAKR